MPLAHGNKRKIYFYAFIILYMFRIDFLTLTSIIFGHGGVYRILQAVMYISLFTLAILSLKLLTKNIKKDIIWLYIGLILLIVISCLLDSRVLSLIIAEKLFSGILISAITGYALFRLIDDFDLFFSVLIKISYAVILYATIIVLTSSIGSAYMGFSYGILLFVLAALYDGLFNKNKLSLLWGMLGVLVNVLGGTRGSLLCIAALICSFFMLTKKWKRAIGFILVISLTIVEYNNLIKLLGYISNQLGIDSRIVSALQGINMSDIAYGNGRDTITAVSYQLINENPFGYGILRDRVLLNENVWWFTTNGYAHNVFLEIWLQFGLFFGTAIIIWGCSKVLKFAHEFNYTDPAMAVGLICLCYCVSLFVSRSYITSFVFWGFWAVNKNINSKAPQTCRYEAHILMPRTY